ncbi:MalY/PatB family protein [Desulfoferula mesophila]|uniref:cysteine-S-conjugate beta-lyase n=1 Tax=Desulfoferula mesophila TaxID=3058419 RepID=A0AAU9ES35_9BACT|nr:cystathionine beta-lyase [Desulfoferula mesophilus]
MIYDFNKVINRDRTNSVKWEFVGHHVAGARDDTLPLWVADMDFPCAQPIIDALHARVDRLIFGYSDPYTEEYLSAVTGWFERRFNWIIDPEHLVVAPGVVPAIGVLLRILTQPGDGVIIQRPVYYPFTNMITGNGRRVINNPLSLSDGRYAMDFADLEAKASDPANTMMILCSPHNPVGRVWTPEELIRAAEICQKHEVVLISDEIHCDLVRRGVTQIPTRLLSDSDQIITCTSASKTFNLAGLHICNCIVSSEKIRQEWQAEQRGRMGLSGGNAMGIAATQAAYNQGEEWLEQVLDYLDANLQFMAEFIAERLPQAAFTIPQGTYLPWIDLRGYGLTGPELEERILGQANIALDQGYIFGPEGEGFERINAACPRSILTDCLERMAKVLEG